MRTLPFFVAVVLWLMLGGLPLGARAQTSPDAGALRQQIEQGIKPALPPKADPLPSVPPPMLALPDGVTLTVKAFRFAGNTLLADERLQPAVRPYLGRPIGFGELQQAAQAAANAYRAAGWIVRAYLPKQDVTDGAVTIQIVEAAFAGARVESPPPTRVDPAILVAQVEAQQKIGAPLNADALDRALLLDDDLPGVSVSGALEPGARDGETALALTARDKPLVSGEVNVDNSGARSTDPLRVSVGANVASPLKRGDALRADLIHSAGSDYVRAAYSVPIGRDGWRVSINASSLEYHLVGDDFAALQARGRSAGTGLDVSYPLVRARQRNLYLNVSADQQRYRNEANGAVQSDYRVDGATVGLTGNLYDDLLGGGANSATLAWREGRVAQGDPDPGENPALGGRFGKLRYGASRLQVLTPRLSLMGALSGQHASKDLDSSERYYLGGPGGVRAYPVNEGGGSRAQVANVELRWRAHPSVTASAFYDWGHASGNANGPSTTLKGYGAGLVWTGPYGTTVRAMVATRDGHNPNPTTSGNDQDGSFKRVRAWVQASVEF